MRAVILSLAMLAGLWGCSSVHLNTGETDYRIAEESTGNLQIKYAGPTDQTKRLIGPDQSVSVSLLQVFIKDFSERAERFAAAAGFGTVRGEIAVVARVFELKDGDTLDFRRSATKKGRLIFYSDDVRSGGHLLNGSALPLYGPITYEGRPLIFEITILELDVGEAEQVKSLLATLANLGAKAYPPASPVLSALDKLGEQLLSGARDDIEFRYYFALYPQHWKRWGYLSEARGRQLRVDAPGAELGHADVRDEARVQSDRLELAEVRTQQRPRGRVWRGGSVAELSGVSRSHVHGAADQYRLHLGRAGCRAEVLGISDRDGGGTGYRGENRFALGCDRQIPRSDRGGARKMPPGRMPSR